MTMAFITEDSMYCNKTSISGEEIENMNLANAVKTFLSAKEDTVITSVDAPENIENLRKVTRNILDDFSIVAKQNETHCLVARQGSVAHFDQYVDEHPQCDAGAKNSNCQHY